MKYMKTKISTYIVLNCAMLGLLLFGATAASAALVSISAVDYADGLVSTNGTLVGALNFVDVQGAATDVVNTVIFDRVTASTSDAAIALAGGVSVDIFDAAGSNNNGSGNIGHAGTLTLNTVFDNGGNGGIIFSGLTIGQAYEIQMVFSDIRDGVQNPVNLGFTNIDVWDDGVGGAPNAGDVTTGSISVAPKLVTGTFTVGGTAAQSFWTMQNTANYGSFDGNIAALQLRAIPPLADVIVVDFSAVPKPLQLYPRNASNLANVSIAGSVISSNCTDITVSVNRAGVAYTNLTQSLTYTADQAAFDFIVPILSELAEYDFTVQVTCTGTPFTVATAAGVVAGDTLLINGQSNAGAMMFNGSANGNQNTWLRSFGYRAEAAAVAQNNLNWYMAEGDANEGPGAIGQWALRMGRLMVETNGVPVAIISGSQGGRPISYFQRTDMDHTDLSSNYGRLLYRVQQAGLQSAIRVILWYQGENDNNDGATHEAGWIQLYQNWRQDFPTVEKVYVCQLHVGCGTTRELPDLRDRQRRLADLDNIIEVMSTTAVPSHTDNCHYAYANGYRVIGESLFRMVQRDLYGVAGSDINPPNPAYAYFSGAGSNEVHIELRDTTDTLIWDAGAHVDFRLEGSAAAPTNGYATAHTIVLQFNQNVSAATGVSYLSHIGSAGPYVKNATDVGLLAFYNIPILAADPGGAPDVPTQLQSILVSSNRVDITWMPTDGALVYLIKRDGVLLGSTAVGHYIDYDVQPDQTYLYQVAAVGSVSTSAWTTAISVQPQNVFGQVPEATDYDILYQLDFAANYVAGSTLDMPYAIDNSGIYTAGIQRVAYYMELQDTPGTPLRWAYASMQAFTNNPVWLGVPVAAKGQTFQTYVQDVNVYSSANSGVTNGRHIATANIEFWGYDYIQTDVVGIPNASSSTYDHGDQIQTSGTYGTMQIHNYAVPQTIMAFNGWGSSTTDEIGIGNATGANSDWTFSASAPTWSTKRLYVLVLTDTDNDDLPDAWERSTIGSLASGRDDDPDEDRMTNWQEWGAGTHPMDAHNILHIATSQPSGDDWVISFPTIAGRAYVVEYKNDLSDTEWQFLPSVEGSGDTMMVTDPGVFNQRFYRVRVQP